MEFGVDESLVSSIEASAGAVVVKFAILNVLARLSRLNTAIDFDSS